LAGRSGWAGLGAYRVPLEQVLEDDHHVEVLEPEDHALEVDDLDVGELHH
jgi:hypothetical protein